MAHHIPPILFDPCCPSLSLTSSCPVPPCWISPLIAPGTPLTPYTTRSPPHKPGSRLEQRHLLPATASARHRATRESRPRLRGNAGALYRLRVCSRAPDRST